MELSESSRVRSENQDLLIERTVVLRSSSTNSEQAGSRHRPSRPSVRWIAADALRDMTSWICGFGWAAECVIPPG